MATATVHKFPTHEDRAVVETAVRVFLTAQSAVARIAMLKAARAVLDRYGIGALHISNCTIKRDLQCNGWAFIVGKVEVSGRRCPGCGADIYDWPGDVRILSIDEGRRYDTVSYGCGCGRIFYKKEAITS